ncbi:MAG: glycerophosphodiester phosphodiesterase [Lachnospiraceae bacterium]|nr:glycerophosphodiester phosphodiesterase [Lachnospiraceae bacterium]
MKTIAIILLVLLVLYLLAIKPRILQRPDYQPFFQYKYAHRGLHNMNPYLKEEDNPYYCNGGCFPENSYSAIKRAADQGYGIEFDVHLTKDGIPVVFHDDTLNRVCGVDGYLKDYTFEELQQFRLMGTDERIPAFADVLKAVNGRTPLIIEYKVEKNTDALCSTCNEILKDYKGLYCIESFHPMAVRWYRTNRPDIVRGQLSESFMKTQPSALFFLLAHLLFNFLTAPDFIAYNHKHHQSVSRTLCRKLYHCLSVAWTIRSQEALDNMKTHFDLFIFEDFIPLA